MKSCYVVNPMAPTAPAAPAGVTARPPYVKFLCVPLKARLMDSLAGITFQYLEVEGWDLVEWSLICFQTIFFSKLLV